MNSAPLPYYYGYEAEQFSFYRIPKQLISDERYRGVSVEAKLLYGLMLDRMALSLKNGWLDEQGRVYIYFVLEEVEEAMCCGHDKALKLFQEGAALIADCEKQLDEAEQIVRRLRKTESGEPEELPFDAEDE